MQPHNSSRVRLWDFVKFLAVFLVIWGHCIKGFFSSDCHDSAMFRYINSFHMPLFMMISGYFSVSSIAMEKMEFFKKKFMRLVYPCIIWGGILWIILEVAYSFHYGNSECSLLGLLTDYYWFSDFWFLKSCFICYVLVYLGVHTKFNQLYWMTITLLISQAISPFFVSFMYPCFLIGYVLRLNSPFMESVKSYPYFLSILFVLMLVFWDKEMWINSHGIPKGIAFFDMQKWVNLIFCRLFRLLIGIVGSLACISIISRIFGVISESRIVSLCCDWGNYTLNIYILQRLVLEMGISRLININNSSSFVINFIIIPFVSLIILVLCVCITKLINMSPKLERVLWGI